MNELVLLTDGSVNTLTKVGFGAYLLVTELEYSLEELSKQVKVKRFEKTSSTKLELQTLLWALNDIQPSGQKLTIYSDSQNIIRLPNRRAHLEQNDYRSKKNIFLRNHQLYREFYDWSDLLDCEFVKVSGHVATKQKDRIDQLFTLVDRSARKALRDYTPQ